MPKKLEVLPGNEYGQLKILVEVERNKQKGRQFRCKCSCVEGNELVVTLTHLVSGHTQSCGCLQRERTGNSRRTHGLSTSSEYRIWSLMIDRCTNVNSPAYDRYRDRGVCVRWKDSFEAFIADMGLRPSDSHSIERRNNDVGYSPDNCYWATSKIQSNNKSNTVFLEDPKTGELRPRALLAEEYGIDQVVLHYRLKRGWSSYKSLATPVRKQSKKMIESDLTKIKEDLRNFSINQVSIKWGISYTAVRNIKVGKSYQDQ